MAKPVNLIGAMYGKRLRVRVCGLCFSVEGSLLMVKHTGIGEKGYFLSPPGGGMEFGESAEVSLRREFFEETGLEVEVKRFLFVHEFLAPPLHAIELFFEVVATGGRLQTGHDPEIGLHEQIIENVNFMTPEALSKEKGVQLHHILHLVNNPKELLKKQGYFKFDNKTL